ncbi:EYxxD motif small membrane protein [Brevibacillus gelatini]|nr:EYxxD motif small membrane protein [Brevibacillus gelatini]
MIVGTPLYEWLSHNLFVAAMIVGAIGVVGYYVFYASKRKGRYRQ